MQRRTLLTTVAAGLLPLAGCTALTELTDEDLPDDCPTSQGLGVEWPRDLNESTVTTFVEEYELQYYQQVVFDFEPESRYSSVGEGIGRVQGVSEFDGGWRVRFSGILGVDEAFTRLEATPSDPPGEAQIIPASEIDDEKLSEMLAEAAETGRAAGRVSAGQTDEYIDRFEALSDEFEITPAEYRDTLYFDVDGTIVELAVSVDTLHADYDWRATYYVDEHVVWRSGEQGIDPRDGELLECRTSS